jgi:DNA-binding GntR family transcriptional regulator
VSARPTAWGAYKTIEDALRRRIAEGEFPADSVLPSEATLTTEYGVARNTLRRALNGLKEDGLLTTVPGRGWIVSAPGEASSDSADPHLQYRRIAAEVRARIDSGELGAGDRVPSGAELVNQYGVSRWTARLALRQLEDAGLITTVHGKGRFVRERPAGDA